MPRNSRQESSRSPGPSPPRTATSTDPPRLRCVLGQAVRPTTLGAIRPGNRDDPSREPQRRPIPPHDRCMLGVRSSRQPTRSPPRIATSADPAHGCCVHGQAVRPQLSARFVPAAATIPAEKPTATSAHPPHERCMLGVRSTAAQLSTRFVPATETIPPENRNVGATPHDRRLPGQVVRLSLSAGIVPATDAIPTENRNVGGSFARPLRAWSGRPPRNSRRDSFRQPRRSPPRTNRNIDASPTPRLRARSGRPPHNSRRDSSRQPRQSPPRNQPIRRRPSRRA